LAREEAVLGESNIKGRSVQDTLLDQPEDLRMKKLLSSLIAVAGMALAASAVQAGDVPSYDHIVVVIMENHGYDQIVGSSAAPYINSTLIANGALFTDSHGVTHPSQPNYIALFSGSTQGVTGDPNISGLNGNGEPQWPLNAPNLGAQLLNAGRTYTGYSEDLPGQGSTVDKADGGLYQAKHNATVMFQNGVGPNQPQNGNLLPSVVNQPYTSFPTDFTQLPTVSFIDPNQINDMHNGSDPQAITNGDNWLANNIESYRQWALTHNSLLITTWDEDDFTASNHIATIFDGAFIKPGQYSETINHYNVLRTIEAAYGLPGIANADGLSPITDVFVPEPASVTLLVLGGLGVVVLRRWQTRS
jgi:acid phosphatase